MDIVVISGYANGIALGGTGSVGPAGRVGGNTDSICFPRVVREGPGMTKGRLCKTGVA